jgi:hypothetical protein
MVLIGGIVFGGKSGGGVAGYFEQQTLPAALGVCGVGTGVPGGDLLESGEEEICGKDGGVAAGSKSLLAGIVLVLSVGGLGEEGGRGVAEEYFLFLESPANFL